MGFSVVTGHRTLTPAEKKRADIAEGTKEGWIMLTEDEQRSKYTDELISALEYWIENNNMVCHSLQGQSRHQTRLEQVHCQGPCHRSTSTSSEDDAHVQSQGTSYSHDPLF
jgi:hypothetical protein